MAEALLSRGDRVVALDRAVGLDLPEGVEALVMDLQDSASMVDLPRRWDGVIHLAAPPSRACSPRPRQWSSTWN